MTTHPTLPSSGLQLTLLTTKEVAEMLRVKERKVYDLAAADEIPHRRITGKLLFPRHELMAWINGNGAQTKAERPVVLAGSHDPLLDWAVRESGSGMATLLNGSQDGLDKFSAGAAAVAGVHIPEADGWNVRNVENRELQDCVLITWAVRARGLIVNAKRKDDISAFSDLRGRRIVMRQSGAGAAVLMDGLLTANGMSIEDLTPIDGTARTEADAAASVASDEADAALGIEAMARQFGLSFVPLLQERFDLLVDRRFYFTDPFQTLVRFSQSDDLIQKAHALGGYDLAEIGRVRWISP